MYFVLIAGQRDLDQLPNELGGFAGVVPDRLDLAPAELQEGFRRDHHPVA